MSIEDLKPGLSHQQTILIDAALTVPAVSRSFTGFADMPPVFATAFLVGFVEWTCIESLRPFLSAQERTVGVHVDMSHSAATPVGKYVTANVELVEMQGKRLRFKVVCHDPMGVISEGFHERVVVNFDKFIGQVNKKHGVAQ